MRKLGLAIVGFVFLALSAARAGEAAPPPPPPPPAPTAAEAAVPSEETFAQPVDGTVTAANLNVRPRPGIADGPIDTLVRGDAVRVLARSGKWYRIELPAKVTLWLSARNVDLPPGGVFPATGQINAEGVKVRSAGDFVSPVLAELPRGSRVEVVRKAGDWVRIRPPAGACGWVYGDYLHLAAQPALAGRQPPEQPAPPVSPLPPIGEQPKPPSGGEKPKPPSGEPVKIEGPGVELFAEAEDTYRRESARENPNFVPAYLLYLKAYSVEGLPEPARRTCQERLREISAKLTDAQKKEAEEMLRKSRQAELARVDAEIRKIMEEARSRKVAVPRSSPPAFAAIGVLGRAAPLPGAPGTYKLSISGVMIYYLRPAAPGVRLEAFVGRNVGVAGSARFVPGWGLQVIDVTDVREVRGGPESRGGFEPVRALRD